MRFKNALSVRILVYFLIITNTTFGQKLVKEFFTEEGKETDEASSYYFSLGKKMEFFELNQKRVVESYVDTLRTYYSQSGKLRSVTLYTSDGVLQGNYSAYHENGKIKEKGSHFADRKIGYFISWYDNGKPHKTIRYPEKSGELSSHPINDFKIISYWDSLGNPVITNANGFCECYLGNSKGFKEVGKVVNGVRDSLWVLFSNDSLRFREEYKMGVFVKGVRYTGDKEYPYTEFEKPPEFKGGLEAMYKFLATNMRYPAAARRLGLEGSIYIGFVVTSDGTIRDVALIKGIGISCDEEALRVVKSFPKWVPGVQRGEPVNVKFVLPIKFKIDN